MTLFYFIKIEKINWFFKIRINMKFCCVYLPGSFGKFATSKIVFDADSNHSSNVSLKLLFRKIIQSL